MKYLISFISFIIFLQIFSICSYAQQYEDIVYLKNGSIVHGIIMEQIPGESIKIKTKDGNIFVFKMEEIEKMIKEEISIKKDEIKKVENDSIKIKDLKANLKTDTNKNKKKELIANNSLTIQPIGLLTLLTNIEYDRALSKKFSTGIKISFMTFFMRNSIKFEGDPVDVENAESIRGSLSAWGIGSHIRYYPGNRAVEGFFFGLAFERLSFSGDEVNGDVIKTTINHKLKVVRLEFEIGSRSKLSSGNGGFTIQWSLGAGVGFGNGWMGNDGGEDNSKTFPVGSFGFGIGYSF